MRLLSLSDGNLVTVVCTLNPTVFKNAVPKEIEECSDWTKMQRNKANSCDALNTADELATWVCYSQGFGDIL